MAAVTHRLNGSSSTDGPTYTTVGFTPGASELLVVFAESADSLVAANPTLTDSQGLGFTRITSATKRVGVDTVYCFVANTLAAAASMTLTFDCTGDNATAFIVHVAGVSGMSKTGAAAVMQSKPISDQAGGVPPAVTFDASALTGNPTLGCVANNQTPAGLTAPTNWTEGADTGVTVPTIGLEYVFRDSGFTGTTITWGSNNSGTWGALIIELDTSAAGPGFTNTVPPTVSGTLNVGGTLTANPGTWTPTPGSFQYYWHRADDAVGTNLVEIAGATGSTYTMAAADSGKYIHAGVIPLI